MVLILVLIVIVILRTLIILAIQDDLVRVLSKISIVHHLLLSLHLLVVGQLSRIVHGYLSSVVEVHIT